jgi:uncharacterized membrane protein (DUF2068 family)
VAKQLRKKSLGIQLLTVEKSMGALFFLSATVVLFVLDVRGITHPIQSLFAEELQEDPHDLVANLLVRLVPQVSRTALLTLALISAAYFVLHIVEAAGLWLGRTWVEYLVLIETAAFLPYEAYDIARQLTWFRFAILLVNVSIVSYLAGRRVGLRRSTGRVDRQK